MTAHCKYAACTTARPLISYELEMGWHVPCLNAKHKKDRYQKVDMTTTKKAEQEAQYYQERKQRRATA